MDEFFELDPIFIAIPNKIINYKNSQFLLSTKFIL